MSGSLRFWFLGLMFHLFLTKAVVSQGVEVNPNRNIISLGDQRHSGQVICEVSGTSVNVTSVAVIMVGDTGETNELLTLTRQTPVASIALDGLLGNGTLQRNSGFILLEQVDAAYCASSYFLCEVIFHGSSGKEERAVATAWSKSSQVDTSGSNDTIDLLTLRERAEEMATDLEKLNASFVSLLAERQHEVDEQKKIAATLDKLENISSSSNLCNQCSNTSQAVDKLEKRVAVLENMSLPTDGPYPEVVKGCFRGMNKTTSEPFVILRDEKMGRDVRCDAQADGGGWIVISSRSVGDVDFHRNWTEYKDGFGNLTTDFWLGNDVIHLYTTQNKAEMRVDVTRKGATQGLYRVYEPFSIGDEASQYRLQIQTSNNGTLSESVSNGLSAYNNMQFSTKDRDNDLVEGSHCAASDFFGACWYGDKCLYTNMNCIFKEIAFDTLYVTVFEMKIRFI